MLRLRELSLCKMRQAFAFYAEHIALQHPRAYQLHGVDHRQLGIKVDE
jgi:hypothetical protein